MVYQFLKIITTIAIKYFFRRIYINGLENVPKDKPLFIACNHPAGFIEPVITACIFPRPLSFLTRGDLFRNKALGPLLRATNQIPIFRFRDGFSNLRQNKESIKRVVEVLKNNNAIMIFVEGSTHNAWHLRPLKKGMGSMLMQTIQQDPHLDIHVLPMGITLTKSGMPGAEVFINFGKAIQVKKLADPDSPDFIQQYNDKLYPLMQENLLHLNTKRHEWHVKRWIELKNFTSSYSFWPRLTYNSDKFYEINKIVQNINNKSSEELSDLRQHLKETKDEITASKLPYPATGFSNNALLLKYVYLLLGIPGFIFHLLPIGLAGQLTARYVSTIEFFGAVLAASSLGCTFLWYLLVFLVLAFSWSWMYTLPLLVLLAFSGISFLKYEELAECHDNQEWKAKVKGILAEIV